MLAYLYIQIITLLAILSLISSEKSV